MQSMSEGPLSGGQQARHAKVRLYFDRFGRPKTVYKSILEDILLFW